MCQLTELERKRRSADDCLLKQPQLVRLAGDKVKGPSQVFRGLDEATESDGEDGPHRDRIEARARGDERRLHHDGTMRGCCRRCGAAAERIGWKKSDGAAAGGLSGADYRAGEAPSQGGTTTGGCVRTPPPLPPLPPPLPDHTRAWLHTSRTTNCRRQR